MIVGILIVNNKTFVNVYLRNNCLIFCYKQNNNKFRVQ